MTDAMRYVDWTRHSENQLACPGCGAGYPRPCPCGGQVHREVMTLPGGGYIQMTRCERCHMPDGR